MRVGPRERAQRPATGLPFAGGAAARRCGQWEKAAGAAGGTGRLSGSVVGGGAGPPPGVAVAWLDGVLDREPVLGADLLALARFTAEYYLAPLGEVLRSMLPADLEPWGDRRVWLTDGGALAPPRNDLESLVIEALRGGGRLTVSDLQARLGLPDLDPVLAELEAAGRVAGEDTRASQ